MRIGIVASLLSLSLVGLSFAADTNAAVRRYELNIPRQPLDTALKDLAQQTGLQLGRFNDTRKDETSVGPLTGSYSAEQALEALLASSGLTFRPLNERAFIVLSKDQAQERNAPSDRASTGGNGGPVVVAQGGGGTSAADSDTTLEEIVVSAQKRLERLIDVPISIVALSGNELEKRKVTSLDDLAFAVPGLAVQSSGSFQRRIMLRGVSNTYGSFSLIGLYLDEASVTSASPVIQLDLPTYDLQRVEVLRGPQGTLYGEGSAGGTIRFITRDPVLNEFSASGTLAALSTQGEPGGRIEGALNVPLITDELGFRLSGVVNEQGGWIDQPGVGREDFNDQSLTNVRLKTRWEPTPELAASVMAVVHRNEGAPNLGENSSGDYAQTFNLTTTPDVSDDYEIYNLTLSYDFSGAQLLGTATYIDQDKELRNQGFRFPLLGTGFDAHFLRDHRWSGISTEELRLISTGERRWKWSFGGFHQSARYFRDLWQYFAAPIPPGAPLPALLFTPMRLEYDSWAVFGDTSFDVTDRLTLGTGLRQFEQRQRFTTTVTQRAEFDSLNPRFYAQYKPARDVNLYASAAKGFRSGGFNNLPTQPPFDPESVWTYELGTKLSRLEGALSVEAALFYTDYSDYQIAGFIPSNPAAGNVTSNAGDARIRGIELAFTWSPIEDWTLSLNGNYVDTEFVEINANSSSHAVGDPLDLFPEYGYTVAAQRDFRASGKPGFVRLDYNEQGPMTYRNRRNGPLYFNESDVINMLNLHAGLEWSENVSFGLFAQNLLDDREFTDPFSIEENAARARPRTFGIEFGVSF